MTRATPDIDGVSYTFESVLGQGGTAEVWKVRSSADGRVYALKRIAKGVGSRRRNERFRNEIEFGMLATNDHVVRIHAESEDQDYFYYTMDLYSKSLREIIAEESDYEVLLDYLYQLCDGLAYVHRQGIVHRDIKPENILVDPENRRLVLADFGIAHFKDSTLTKRGELLANRNYQAPEQMAMKNAGDIGEPADIFALGLIITEVFTKQNPRGIRRLRVGDIHPFLSDLDLLVERMLQQDENQRIGAEAVRDSLHLIRRHVRSRVEEIGEELRGTDGPIGGNHSETDLILERAGKDVLSAKYIFERVPDDHLSRYNPNYHCEISYSASAELYNACVQSELYSICKAKFQYEASGGWSESDMDLVVSPRKASLLREFESIQRQYPLPPYSIWRGVPRMAAHYFRFCKDYHCEELMETTRRLVSISSDSRVGSFRHDLMDAPIIWIATSARRYLRTDLFETSTQNLQRIEFERQVSVHWEGTCLDDSSRTSVGADLFSEPYDAESVSHILEEFGKRWDVSFGERVDGRYSIHFRSRDEYLRFRKEALGLAAPYDVFEADVRDLLQPEDSYEDLVALIWDHEFDIRSTLAKLLRLREISEDPARPDSQSLSSTSPRKGSTPA